LEKVLRPDAPRGLWNQRDSPTRELVGLELGTQAIRTIDLTNLGDVKVGTFTLPLELLWTVIQQVLGWGPTVVSGQFGRVGDHLRLSAEIRPAVSVRAHVASRPVSEGVQPLARDIAFWIVHTALAGSSGTSLDGFREITAGLSKLREHEATLSRLALQEAARHFDGAIAQDSRVPTAYYNRGIVADLHGHRELATEMYASAMKRQPSFYAAVLRHALLLAKDRQYERAEKFIRDLMSVEEPYGRLAYVYLADLALAREQSHEALRLWTAIAAWSFGSDTRGRVLREKVEARRRLLAKRTAEADWAVTGVELATRPSVSLLTLGNRYDAFRMYRHAESAFEAAGLTAVGDSDRILAHAHAARARFLAGEPRGALEMYESLARETNVSGRNPGADSSASPALALDYWLGRLALETGDAKRARQFLERYLRTPKSRPVLFDLGRVAFELENSPERAIEIYSRVNEGDGVVNYLNAQENIAWLRAQTGHVCEAAMIMARIARRAPTDLSSVVVARRRAWLAQHLTVTTGDAARASEAAGEALAHDVGSAGAYNALALLALHTDDAGAVHRLLRRAWEFGTEEERGMALSIVGEVEWRKGRTREAVALLEDSRLLRHSDPTTYLLLAAVTAEWRAPKKINEASLQVHGKLQRMRLKDLMAAPPKPSAGVGSVRRRLCVDCPCQPPLEGRLGRRRG
ncbi:MAG: tetratricopeptide repeat protein, partial [Longimicrobiales bacterium]